MLKLLAYSASRVLPVLALLGLPGVSSAAVFAIDGATLNVTGPFLSRDSVMFTAKLDEAVAAGSPIEAVSLNSPGGLIGEARLIANAIHTQRLVTVVPDHATCASACFMVFAAGAVRAVGQDVKIGVHSATQVVGSRIDDASGTLFMARYVAKFDVPPEVIARMVETASFEVAWLSDADLRGMGAVALDVPEEHQKPTAVSEPQLDLKTILNYPKAHPTCNKDGEPTNTGGNDTSSALVVGYPHPYLLVSKPACGEGK